jgi:transcriptional regulator with PAS, ATPase and Fis domain
MSERVRDATSTLTSLHASALAVPSLRVIVSDSGGNEASVPLEMAPCVVGTDEGCDVRVIDPHVSRRHCEVSLTDAGVVLRDLGSKNGTFIGNVEVREAVVQPGTIVRFGDHLLVVRVTGAPREIPLSLSARFGAAVGGTVNMRALFARLEVAARTDETVLLLGDSGTGKELLARGIHDASARRAGPFTVFDCGAVAPSLVEAELFGFVRGAFTGADRERAGIFEQANGGTLFLDEIGELPLDVQPKLLRALESRQAKRVGGSSWIPLDVRIVAATHRDLAANMASGAFRPDLYYRLAVLQARVPPLRERRDDIELLTERFLAEWSPPLTVHDLPPGTLEMLRRHEWPGNVRELRNALSRIVVFREADLGAGNTGMRGDGETLLSLPLRDARQQVIERFEHDYVTKQLAAHGGNVTRAAEACGVSRQFLHRLIERYRVRDDDD